MKTNPLSLVSIIIPVYNTEDYLEDALNSCLHQTYPNIEIIGVDNNSVDKSREILRKYFKNYPDKIKVFSETEPGAPAARNKGLKEAKGDYIYFLDADDALEENAIRLLISEISNEIDAVCGSETYYQDHFLCSPLFVRQRLRNIDYQMVDILNSHPTCGSLLLRKSAIKNVRWNNSLGSGQELVFWSELVLTNNVKIKYIPETVCKIRIHQSPYRISNKNRKVRIFNHYLAILRIDQLFKSSPYKSSQAEIALNDRKLRHAFHAIHARNFKVSYLTVKTVNKKLVKKSSKFKWFSKEGVYYLSNLYIGFIFYFLNNKVRKGIRFYH